MSRYSFGLEKDVVLVEGATRAAIYDLRDGSVYSVDGLSKMLLSACEKGISLAEIFSLASSLSEADSLRYLDQLCEVGLGRYLSEGERIEKVDLIRPIPSLGFMWLEVSAGCNLKCIHCYAGSNPALIGSEKMDQEAWQKVMLEARALGCEQLQFIGGEPLLLGDKLVSLVEFANLSGFLFIEVFTNGTLLSDEMISVFVKNNVRVAISFYGERRSTHEQITLSGGSYEKTLDSIKRLLRAGVELRVAVVGMKQNEEECDKTLAFLTELGVKRVQFDVVRPSGRGTSNNLVSEKLLSSSVLKSPAFPECTMDTFIRRQQGHNCFLTKICVGADGIICPCIMERNTHYGNVLRQPLSEILSCEAARRAKKLSKDKIDVCRDCEYRYACSDCRPRALGGDNLPFNAKPRECLYDPYSGIWNA